jgi:integrase
MADTLASRTLQRDPFLDPALPTLADVLAALARPAHAGRKDLPDLRSAVRTAARVLGLPPASITAHPGVLGQLLARVVPAAHGLRPSRWANVRSLLGKALALAGCDLLPARTVAPLDPAWQELARRLKVKALEIGLSRLMHFCSGQGIAPEAVDDAVMARFRTALEHSSLVRQPGQVHYSATRSWNRAAAAVPGWPATRVSVPPRVRQTYVLRPEVFSMSFNADLEAWLARLAGEDLLAELPFRPVRPSTLARRRFQILQLASGLVHRGRDPATLTRLADLVAPAATVREALRFFLERAGGRTTRQVHQLATVALMIAKHWVGLPKAQVEELRALVRRCDPEIRGLTAKNRAALRRLEDDPTLVRELLTLPDRLARGLARKPAAAFTRNDAVRLQTASAIAILLAAPIRVGNLAGLRLDRHLLRQGQGATRLVRLVVPAEEVKNHQELEHPLPPWVVALLELYLARARPLLQPRPSPWLFPGRRPDRPKHPHRLRQQIAEATEAALGLRLTPHQFRHACGLIYLAAHPGGHEVVRHLLGHRSLATTLRFYAGMETAAALRRYDAVVLERREKAAAAAAAPPAGGTGRGRRG